MASPSPLDAVDAKFGSLPYMTRHQGERLRQLFSDVKPKQCLELGFFHGKSSAYIAAILREMGAGHLTTIDREVARSQSPNIDQVLAELNLSQWVTVFYEPSSFTWRLLKMMEENPPPRFDFCYFDGGHSWDVTGFAFFLADRLLKPGAWILFDDLNWKFSSMFKEGEPPPDWLANKPKEEIETPQVRKVWDLLVTTHPGYHRFQVERGWAFAQKKK